MSVTVRLATEGDVSAAAEALKDGKAALAVRGIPQWQRGEYPDAFDIAEGVGLGIDYVAVAEGGEVVGTMALSFDGESTYDDLDEGAWLTDCTSAEPTYGVIHRCAVRATAARTGVMGAMFEAAENIARERGAASMRIDTHELNLPMQGLLAKRGYRRCGTITLPYEHEIDPKRLTFEKLL